MGNNTLFYKQMENIFKDEFDKFCDELNKPLKQSVFLNTLKAPKEDILKVIDFKLIDSPYNPNSMYYSDIQIGKTIAYDLGLIYPQEMSASTPAMILNPKEDCIVVDMCSAPGGKSINLANITRDNSLMISNEYEYKRATILTSNLERMGISNVIVTNKNGNELAKDLYSMADYVLLDAPCSGEGMARKHTSVIEDYTYANVEHCASMQNELIENAYDILKPGGYLVYSTCTYETLENEEMISNFLSKHDDMEMIDIDHKFKRRGIGNDKAIRLTILDDTEGQFACLMKKKGVLEKTSFKPKKCIKNKIIDDFIKNELDIKEYYIYEQNGYYYMSLKPMIDLGKNVLRYGIFLGEIKKNIFHPSFTLYRANALKNHFKHIIELNDEEYLKYRSGLSVFKDYPNGYYLLTYKNFSFSYTKLSNKELKNKHPKGLRF